jgi:flagellar biosynthesis GTPase FlhF
MEPTDPASDAFQTAATQVLEGLQLQRSLLLATVADVHGALGLLAGIEADRLAQKYGADDERVQLLRDRGEAAAARVDALVVEQEIAAVRTPAPAAKGVLIHGRITDTMRRAAGSVSVQLTDQKGQPLQGVDAVAADDSGYFAIELSPEVIKATGSDTKLVLLLSNVDAQLVPAAFEPISIAQGADEIQDVTLNRTELERLRLRMAVAENAVTVKVADADATAAADKAVADKAAADKAAADKAAAQKAAAAEKAAAEKAAAEKAAAEKAAADKAAAEKAAAAKAAAEKAAADKAAADKPGTPPVKPRGGDKGKP